MPVALSGNQLPQLTVQRRLMIGVLLGVIVGTAVLVAYGPPRPVRTDLTETWAAARAMLEGQDPYETLDRAFKSGAYNFPLVYPGTALVAVAPFGALPVHWAMAAWTCLGMVALVWALSSRGWWGLIGLGSAFVLHALIGVQWSPLLTSGVVLPSLSFLWAAKPTVGLSLFVGWPSRKAIIGGAMLVVVSFLLIPGWLGPFLANTKDLPHVVPPVLRPGGFLLLLSFLRWRRPEARMLGVLACVPHTVRPYEMLPLLLIPRRPWDMAALTGLSLVGWYLALHFAYGDPVHDLANTIAGQWPYYLMFMYLPALILVLRDQNAASITPLESNVSGETVDRLT